MISKEYTNIGSKSSAIREMFDLALERSKVVGEENVYNFCIGNPNVPTPECVKEELMHLLETENPFHLHGYTTSAGDEEARDAIAEGLNDRYGTHFTRENLYFTVGAACALNICFRALCNPGDEFISFAPYFPEYRFYLETIGVKFVAVPSRTEDFQIDPDTFEKAITEKTKGVIVNSPNNPSGAVYSKETMKVYVKYWQKKRRNTATQFISLRMSRTVKSPTMWKFRISRTFIAIHLCAILTANVFPSPASEWDILLCRRRLMSLIRLKRQFPGQRVSSVTSTPRQCSSFL